MDSSELNSWNVPVLHDAIRAAVFSSRFGRNRALPGEPPDIEIVSTPEQFDTAFGVLERIIAAGADVNTKDTAGNPALMRAVLDARQVLDEPVLIELREDLHRIFDLLLHAGADKEWIDPRTADRLVDSTKGHPVRQFLPD